MSAGRSILTAAKAAARNKTVRRIALPAAMAAGNRIGPIAQQRYGDWRDRRVYRDRARKLARQMGGTVSEDTIIAGEPHFVVWRDGQPVQAFPHVDELATRPELAGFNARLAQTPGEQRKRLRPKRR